MEFAWNHTDNANFKHAKLPETPLSPSWCPLRFFHLTKICQSQSALPSSQLQNSSELLITSIISQACLKCTHDLKLLSQHTEFRLPLRRRDPCNDSENEGAGPGVLFL